MKTPLQKLIEQLDEKIERVNKFIEKQDEFGLTMSLGVLAGFSERLVCSPLLRVLFLVFVRVRSLFFAE